LYQGARKKNKEIASNTKVKGTTAPGTREFLGIHPENTIKKQLINSYMLELHY
jgi:hypothetical protein